MKRIHTLVAIVLGFICLTACEWQKQPTDNTVAFDLLQIDENYFLNNDPNLPGCNIRIAFMYPDSATNEEQLRTLQTIFVEKVLGSYFKSLSPEKAVKGYTEQYISEFKRFEQMTDYSDYLDNESAYEDESGYSYYTHISNEVLYNKNGFVSFKVETTSYEGGAHGSKSTYGYVIQLNDMSLLSQDDFAGANFRETFGGVIAQKIAEANGLTKPEELENIGYYSLEEIVPNNNFTLDERGITYYYNENEIAGYMVGTSELFIPYEELNIYIQPNSPLARLTR